MTIEQYLIDNNILHLWGEKNTLPPSSYTTGSHKKIWIKCDKNENHPEYEIAAGSFFIGQRCSYCKGMKVCYDNSLAKWMIENLGSDSIKKYWGDKNKNTPNEYTFKSAKKVWIKCQENKSHPEYEISVFNFSNGRRCSYCRSLKVCYDNSLAKHIEENIGIDSIKKLWSEKNDKLPYEYTLKSNKKVFWKCNMGIHEDYERGINESNVYRFRCPRCSEERIESSLQEKTRLYLVEKKYSVNHEHSCSLKPTNPKTKRIMPFDNEIIKLKLIIEVHGAQHYNLNNQKSSWLNNIITPEQSLHKRKLYDRYKSYIAYINGYHYLAIPYWEFDSNDTYKTTIDNKIKEILETN